MRHYIRTSLIEHVGLLTIGFALGSVFTVWWSVGTHEGKRWMNEHRNDPIIEWMPNLPG